MGFRLNIALERAKKAASDAAQHLRDMQQIEYLTFIDRNNSVEMSGRSMADLIGLAEEGLITDRGGKWSLTDKGRDLVRYWSDPKLKD